MIQQVYLAEYQKVVDQRHPAPGAAVEEDVENDSNMEGQKNENEGHDCRFGYSFGWK